MKDKNPLLLSFILLLLAGSSACQLTSGFPYKSTLEAIATREDQRVGVDEIYPYFENEHAGLRRRAALALANLRNQEAVDFIVQQLDRERDTVVAEMLLFALGQIGSPEGSDAVQKFFASSVATVRAAAVEGAGKLGNPQLTASIVQRLVEDPSPYVRAEACLALFRLGAKRYAVMPELDRESARKRTEALTLAMLEDQSPAVRWRAAYALAGIEDPAGSDALRQALLTDEDLWVRCFAARGLSVMPNDSRSYKALTEAIDLTRRSGEWNVAVEAIKALGNYLEDEGSRLETAAQLINYLLPGKNANFHVRAAAARTLGRFSIEEETAGDTILKALVRSTNDPSPTVVGEAVVALGALGFAGDILAELAESEDRFIRLKAVEAAGQMGSDGVDLLLELAEDISIRVRNAALEALSSSEFEEFKEEIIPLAEEALVLNDLSLRYTAAKLLMDMDSRSSVPLLKAAYSRSLAPELAEARLKMVEAAAALGTPDDEPFFKQAIDDEDFDVRNAAYKALATISGELYQVEPRTFVRQVHPEVGVDYMDGNPNPVAHFVTNKGEFWIELFKEEAPAHVKNFIQLADEGVYNKLTFHRMVSNFVVQGLDPRGDGWGFHNIRLRDEINRRKFLSGYVGMPNSGPDTGGCQIFVTHCPTPHLDGKYTLFGRVIAGMDSVDLLEVGDRVFRITIK